MGKRNYKKGFSLIEIIISFLLFSIIIISSYFVITRLFDMKKNNEEIYKEEPNIGK